MPVRNPSNRYGRNIVGRFPSLKLGRMVAFESRIEQDQIYLMEYDQNIVFYEEQPLTIEYRFENKLYKYTPDFQVVDANDRYTLVECKPQKFVVTDKNQRKFDAGKLWCTSRNWELRVGHGRIRLRFRRNPTVTQSGLGYGLKKGEEWSGVVP